MKGVFFITGRTHATFGVAASLMLPNSSLGKEKYLMIPAIIVGSLISDIDIREKKTRIVVSTVTMALYILFYFIYTNVSHDTILSFAEKYRDPALQITGIIIFIVFCIYGSRTEHRTFTHSIVGIAVASGSVFLINPVVGMYFSLGMVLHVALDLFNKKMVNLFWPLRGSAYIGLCKANGFLNDLVFFISILLIFVSLLP